ncbi:MAG: helix-turn-helix domain-containing protein [Patescibacteria group bacterium]|jgi:cytoskeletal protein RodZ
MFRASTILKNARLDKDLEVNEVAKKLKIPSKYIQAIESEDTVCFPSEPYCSLIVKDYADFLGLNGQEILKLFRRDFAQKKKVKTAKKEFFSFTPQFTFTASIVFFTLIFAAYLTSEYIKFNSPPKLKIEAPHEAVLGSYIEVSGNTDPESAVRINQDLVIVDQNGNFNKKVLVNNTNTKIFVESKSPSGKVTTQEMIVNSR